MDLIYRKASMEDLDAVDLIYKHIHDAEEAGLVTIGWDRAIYPVRETAEAALERGDLYVCEKSGVIVATAIINQLQVDVYYGADWMYEADDEDVYVLHTLVVDPASAGMGIGKGFVAFYESQAREMNCSVLRMDTNEKNAAARKLYAGLGYREADIVPTVFNGISGVRLVLLEKAM